MALGAGLVGLAADRLDPRRSGLKTWAIVPFNFLALVLVYVIGVVYLYGVMNLYVGEDMTFLKTIQVGHDSIFDQ